MVIINVINQNGGYCTSFSSLILIGVPSMQHCDSWSAGLLHESLSQRHIEIGKIWITRVKVNYALAEELTVGGIE